MHNFLWVDVHLILATASSLCQLPVCHGASASSFSVLLATSVLSLFLSSCLANTYPPSVTRFLLFGPGSIFSVYLDCADILKYPFTFQTLFLYNKSNCRNRSSGGMKKTQDPASSNFCS